MVCGTNAHGNMDVECNCQNPLLIVRKHGYKVILLDRHYYCSAMRQLKIEDGDRRTKRPLRITQETLQNGQVLGRGDVMKMSRIKTTSTAIVRMGRLFLPTAKKYGATQRMTGCNTASSLRSFVRSITQTI